MVSFLEKFKQGLSALRTPIFHSESLKKDGLSHAAFAIVGDCQQPETWKLPHHTRAIFRALAGKLNMERTVDWARMAAAVAALSPGGFRGQRVEATSGQIMAAVRHLAEHYQRANKPLPETLQMLLK